MLPLRWLLLGNFLVWSAFLGPPLTLLAWFADWPTVAILAASVFVSPLLLFLFLRALRGSSARRRWWWAQTFGLGALLMPLVAGAALIEPWSNGPSVAGAVVLLWLALALHAHWQALRVRTRHLVVPAPQLERSVRLVQISDVHIGSRSAEFLETIVARVHAEHPDILVITGDLLDTSAVGTRELAALGGLECPSYLCIGNHERYVDLSAAVSAIEQHGVTVLRDRSVLLDQGLRITGLDDRDRPTELPAVLETLDRSGANFEIGLYHRPDGWPALLDAGVDLSLAGHTHGGQIWPFGLVVKRQYPRMVGLFRTGNQRLYVSPGTGTWGPTLRLGTHSEMTVIDLDAS